MKVTHSPFTRIARLFVPKPEDTAAVVLARSAAAAGVVAAALALWPKGPPPPIGFVDVSQTDGAQRRASDGLRTLSQR